MTDDLGKPLPLFHMLGQVSENHWRNVLADLFVADPATGIDFLQGVADARSIQPAEYSAVGVSVETERIDLALTVNGKRRIVVEAKTHGTFETNQLSRISGKLDDSSAVLKFVLAPRWFTLPRRHKRLAGGADWIDVSWEGMIEAFTRSTVPWVKTIAEKWSALAAEVLLTEAFEPDPERPWTDQYAGGSAMQVRARMLSGARWAEERIRASLPASADVGVATEFASRASRPVIEVGANYRGFWAFAHVLEHATSALPTLKRPILQVGLAPTSTNGAQASDEEVARFNHRMSGAIGHRAELRNTPPAADEIKETLHRHPGRIKRYWFTGAPDGPSDETTTLGDVVEVLVLQSCLWGVSASSVVVPAGGVLVSSAPV